MGEQPAGAPIYRDLDRDALEWQYNARAQVPEGEALIGRMQEASEAFRAGARCVLDVAYGEGPRQRLDLFLPARTPAPVLLFVHGGYWRSRDKSIFSFVAEALVEAGALVALAGYDLCPQVSLDRVVEEVRECCAWLYRNCARHGGDPARIHVAGHSAGGHLAAMLAVTDWRAFDAALPADLVTSATPISGLFDLEPLRLHSLNDDLRLDVAAARRNSPRLLTPGGLPVTVCVGADESAEFRRQSRELAESWRGTDARVQYLELTGRNHFTVIADLADPDYPLTRVLLDHLAGR